MSDSGRISGDLWLQNTRVPGLSCGIVCVIVRLAVLVELRHSATRCLRSDAKSCRGTGFATSSSMRPIAIGAMVEQPGGQRAFLVTTLIIILNVVSEMQSILHNP